jgi:hypothetical protein
VCGEWCKLHWLLLDTPTFDWNNRRSRRHKIFKMAPTKQQWPKEKFWIRYNLFRTPCISLVLVLAREKKWLLRHVFACSPSACRWGRQLQEGEASNSILISINVIVNITDGGRFKLPKHVAENKLMYSIYSVVSILIIKTDIQRVLKSAFFLTLRFVAYTFKSWMINFDKGLFILFTFGDTSKVDSPLIQERSL